LTRFYYHTDMLGSTRTVVTAAGANAEGYTYYPYGLLNEGLSANFGATKEGFTGKERDAETALSYFGARYYMPALGRWGAVDPLADRFAGWSGYNYVMGNPSGLVDPDGRCPEFITGRPCSVGLAIAVGFVPVVGDGIDILGAAIGRDLLTGEAITGVGVAATVVGTIVGSGRLARKGVEVAEQAVRKADDVVEGVRAAESVGVSRGAEVFRVWGDAAGPNGRSWTTIDPGSVPNYRDAAGLPSSNTGRFVSEGVLDDVTGVTTRQSLPLDGNRGGLPEVIIPDPAEQVSLTRVSGVNR
jgi:RHS repeat-associated protein